MNPRTVRALFDINLLIAMVDEEHVHHERAHAWWAENHEYGWASCPLTQNGFIRVISQPNYTNPITTTFALDLLAQQAAETDHVFWPDEISLLDTQLFDRERILGPRQLTDIYLLAIAVRNGGRFATLDQTIPLDAVRGAELRHVAVV
jgi:uncharacterized protein